MKRRDFIAGFAVSVATDAALFRTAAKAKDAATTAVMAELVFASRDANAAADILAKLAAATRLEPGCRRYDVGQNLEDPGRFHLSEIWDDHSSLAAHFKTPHMKEFSSAASKLGYSAVNMKQIEIGSIADLDPRALAATPK
jgi:quinol monooxygenase YgiN